MRHETYMAHKGGGGMKVIHVSHDESQLLGHMTKFKAVFGFSKNYREYILGLTFNVSNKERPHKWIEFHFLFKTIRLRLHNRTKETTK